MIKNYSKQFLSLILLVFFVLGCTATGKKSTKVFKHDTPLIKEDVKARGQTEVDKTVDMGPTPAEADVVKLNKRKWNFNNSRSG